MWCISNRSFHRLYHSFCCHRSQGLLPQKEPRTQPTSCFSNCYYCICLGNWFIYNIGLYCFYHGLCILCRSLSDLQSIPKFDQELCGCLWSRILCQRHKDHLSKEHQLDQCCAWSLLGCLFRLGGICCDWMVCLSQLFIEVVVMILFSKYE